MLQPTDVKKLRNKEGSMRVGDYKSHCEGEIGWTLPVVGRATWSMDGKRKDQVGVGWRETVLGETTAI